MHCHKGLSLLISGTANNSSPQPSLLRVDASGEKAFYCCRSATGRTDRSSPALRSSGIAAGPARLPTGPRVRGAAGMRIGDDGGGRDVDWQHG